MSGNPNSRPLRLSRRQAFKTAATAGTALALAGCGRGLGGSSHSESSSLQMMFWGEGNQSVKIAQAIKDWENNGGKTKVNAQYGPLNGYYDKLATRVSGGNTPDIFQLHLPYLSDYLSRGVILPLDKYASELGLNDVPSSVMPTIKTNGHYYCALMGAATQPAVISNVDALKKYSIPQPAEDWTLQDFLQTMKEVHKASKGKLYGISDGGGASVQLESYLRAYNIPLFNDTGKLAFTQDQFRGWLQMWDTMRKNGSCPPMKVTAATTGFQDDPLTKGMVAFTTPATSRGYLALQALTKNKLALLQYPRASADSKPGTNIIPNGWFAVSKNSKNPDKAVGLLKYLARDPRAIKTMGLSRGVPLSKTQQTAVKGQLNAQDTEVFDNYLQVANSGPADLHLFPAGSSQLMTDSLSTANENVGFGKATVSQAVAQFFDDAQRMLK